MNSSKEPNSLRATHFDTNLQVFNYTDKKSSEADDSLLLTPNEKQSQPKTAAVKTYSFRKSQREEKHQNQAYREVEDFQKGSKRRREEFLKRMTINAAKLEERKQSQKKQKEIEQDEQSTRPVQLMQIQANPNISSPKVIPEKIDEQPQQTVPTKEILSPSVQKPLSAQRQSVPLSSENQEKLKKIMASGKQKEVPAQDVNEPAKEVVEKSKHARKRVTEDLRTLIHLHVFSQGQDDTSDKMQQVTANEPHEANEIATIKRRDSGQVSGKREHENNKRNSLIDRAFHRLSGGQVSRQSRKERVTLDMNELYGMLNENQVKKEGWMQKINSIKEEVEIVKGQTHTIDQKCRQKLRNYIEQTNSRYKSIDDKVKHMNNENTDLKENIRRQENFIQYLDQQISKRKKQSQNIIDKTQRYKHLILSPDAMEQQMTPVYYVQDNYGVRIISVDSNNNSQPGTTVCAFTIDRDIYCRVKKTEGQNSIINIRMSATWQAKIPEFTLDAALRVELLAKYFKIKLDSLPLIESIISLGQYYEQLQLLQNDLSVINQLYTMKDPLLSGNNEKLSFKMEIKQNTDLHIIINLLNYKELNFFILQVVSSQGIEQRIHMEDKKITLIEFITQGLQNILI